MITRRPGSRLGAVVQGAVLALRQDVRAMFSRGLTEGSRRVRRVIGGRGGRVIARALFRLARTRPAGATVRRAFGHAAWAIPVRRVAETRHVLAFRHLRPSWATHVLIVPRVGIRGLGAVERRHAPILQDIFRQADELARSLPEMDGPLCLLANGGAYQDVAQLHFHLIAGSDVLTYRAPAEGRATGLETTDVLTVVEHPDPLWTTHLVVRSEGYGAAPAPFGPPGPDAISALLGTLNGLVRQVTAPGDGYSFVLGGSDGELDLSCVHLVSGSPMPSTRGS